MSETQEPRPLKMCCTCGYWSSRYKGFCLHLETGVGRFWRCTEWRPQEPRQEEIPAGDAAALQAQSR
uniref:Uncharacterized protein n=1 Tax=Desulfobacca acetoxidans TaxID=60893 RepID=A0A7V4G8B5_9BACT